MISSDTPQANGGTFTLGRWKVSRVGYGAMQLAGDNVFGPPRDRDEAMRVLQAAVQAGVNHIDTAQYYGASAVNQLIREALSPYPDNLAIVSKVAARHDDRGGVVPNHEHAQLRAGIEDNLTTLGKDRLAAVNLRLMDASVPGARFDAQLAALVRARDEGLIDGIGLSNITLAHLQRAMAQTQIVCVQNLFNLGYQGSRDVLDECAAHDIAFVPFCPLGSSRVAQNGILANPILAEIAIRLGATPAQLALAWLLDLADNILLIPGTRTRTHLIENLRSAAVRLDGEAHAALAAAFPGPPAL